MLVARMLLSAVFLTSAVAKFRSLSTLEQAVQQLGLGFLGPTMVHAVARLLPPFELLLALFLIAGVWPKVIALVSVGLLIIFTVPMAINIAKGNRFPCNCFGQTRAEIGVGTLSRNGLMIVLGLLLALLSPWTTSGSWLLSLDLFFLSGTDIVAFVTLGVSLYFIILGMSEIDTIFRLLKQKKRST